MLSTGAFSENFRDARERFCEAAARHPALERLWSVPLRELSARGELLLGRDGEDLATDFAWFGAPDAPRVLILCSGTHGAEGLAGSGVQLGALDRLIPNYASRDLAIFLIHALNPWGVSHERRCDHVGVDVMRNFIDFDQEPPKTGELFRRYVSTLSPSAITGPARWFADLTVLWAILRHGMRRLQAEVPVGQYEFEDAPFYGGDAPSWSRQVLESALRRWVGARQAVAMIDIHTGLGAPGQGVILGEHQSLDDVACQRALKWWRDVYEPEIPDSRTRKRFKRGARRTAYRLNGSMPRAVRDRILADETVVSVVHEFGTTPPLTSLNAVRNNHAIWRAAHAAGADALDENSALVRQVRAQMRAAFYPDDPAWRAGVFEQAIDVASRAADGLLEL